MTKRNRDESPAAAECTGPRDLDSGELETVRGGVGLLLPAVQQARESASTRGKKIVEEAVGKVALRAQKI